MKLSKTDNCILVLLWFQVLVGEHDTSDLEVDRREVSKIRIHPKYNHNNADFDFCVLFLSSPLTFSSTIAPVCLPASTQSLYTGQVATVTGWGLTSSGGSPASTLQETEVEVISNEECYDHYPGHIKRYKCYILTSVKQWHTDTGAMLPFYAKHCRWH